MADQRATRAIVDLDAFQSNVRRVLASLRPGCRLMAVVKANAYGHGAAMIARSAVQAGAAQLAVATVAEGLRLRTVGIEVPILVLSPIDFPEIGSALRGGLSLTVADDPVMDRVEAEACRLRLPGPAPVHVKIDTGMRRYGAMPEAAIALAVRVAASPELALEGVFTHFAAADEIEEGFTSEQATRFDRSVEELAARGIRPPQLHAANSAATLRSRRYDYDLVRVGIALYGLPPSPDIPLLSGMRPVLSVRSRVARIIDLAPGDTVGYGRTYRAEMFEQAALVPLGYADGYPRSLSGLGWVALGGRPAPVRGRISMDQTVIGVPAGVQVQPGHEVVVVGEAAGAPGLVDLAGMVGTIPYEMATGIAPRVPRHYVRASEVVAVEDLSGLHEADAGLFAAGSDPSQDM